MNGAAACAVNRIRTDDGSTYQHDMEGAMFPIPTPGLPAKVVDLIAEAPMDDRDIKGDLHEYMLGKIARPPALRTRPDGVRRPRTP